MYSRKAKYIYVAGCVSDDIAKHGYIHCYNKFKMAESTVERMSPNSFALNPMDLCNAGWSWVRCMVVCLRQLVKCDGIYLQPDYFESTGAKIELFVARLFGLRIYGMMPYLNKY